MLPFIVGGLEILNACKKVTASKCGTGEAVITTAGNFRCYLRYSYSWPGLESRKKRKEKRKIG